MITTPYGLHGYIVFACGEDTKHADLMPVVAISEQGELMVTQDPDSTRIVPFCQDIYVPPITVETVWLPSNHYNKDALRAVRKRVLQDHVAAVAWSKK